jgi:hypothetical protein
MDGQIFLETGASSAFPHPGTHPDISQYAFVARMETFSCQPMPAISAVPNDRRLPPNGSKAVMNRSLDLIARFEKQGFRVIAGHDPKQWEQPLLRASRIAYSDRQPGA